MGKLLYLGEVGENRAGAVTCRASTEACDGDRRVSYTSRTFVKWSTTLSPNWKAFSCKA
jgi:hypothetical protein